MTQYGSVSCTVCNKFLYYGTDIIGEISSELRDTHEDKLLRTRNTFYCLDHYVEKE